MKERKKVINSPSLVQIIKPSKLATSKLQKKLTGERELKARAKYLSRSVRVILQDLTLHSQMRVSVQELKNYVFITQELERWRLSVITQELER